MNIVHQLDDLDDTLRTVSEMSPPGWEEADKSGTISVGVGVSTSSAFVRSIQAGDRLRASGEPPDFQRREQVAIRGRSQREDVYVLPLAIGHHSLA